MQLTKPVDCLKGIGPKTAALFEKLNVFTIEDLLKLYPRNYLSYEEPVDIREAEIGRRVTVRASIQSYVDVKKVRSLTLVTCTVKDGTGSIKLTWYNCPFLKQVFHIGQTFVFVGTLLIKNHQPVMEHPEYYTMQQYEKLVSSLQPVYPLTEGLSNKTVKKAVAAALPLTEQLKDMVPEQIRTRFCLMPLAEAVYGTHFPQNMEHLTNCRNRLVFDEFFWFLVHMRLLREKTVKAENHFLVTDWRAAEEFIASLPFSLTKGQLQAVEEIKKDLSGGLVMNRLVQGDVGSGKTAVAEIALLAAVKNGFQTAFMAPTEVLAAQHYEGVTKDLAPFGVRTALLCGSTKIAEKRKIYEALAAGEIDILIGTHALIQEKVIYNHLGLVITDEQHRFGVRQRARLSEKGNEPHVLVMSATPIPRTLAIILYGDLDISVIKDMPASRKPIKNCVVGLQYRQTAYQFMLKQIEQGHQVYIICPMVEAGENMEAENVIEYQESLLEIFPKNVRTAYLHGKMAPEKKNEVMREFAEQKIDILVSTTVIEVGINNPNATVMLIENAEKFGLAQLHQLRGRVGRGDAQSYCIMLCASERQEALDRLNILNTSNDGFFIANEDLKLRGPGDFFGVRQSGDMLFHLGDIYNNACQLKQADEAVSVLEKEKFPLASLINGEEGTKLQL
ncbi:MAG: ATP-dependent DNA helicase RecG [Bacteroidales bacterium]|nr:ATP-dependent DNA helicase RecG [Clostridium sp.]MCM1203138.1 ATP-dependent DNA helicase RecG [Bacteroidales bacterium]